jgi:hypothetical protein
VAANISYLAIPRVDDSEDPSVCLSSYMSLVFLMGSLIISVALQGSSHKELRFKDSGRLNIGE